MQRILDPGHQQDAVEAGDPEQAQADHQQAGDGAAAEGDLQGRVDTMVGGLRGADVGTHRDVHADVAGDTREHGTDQEADRSGHIQEDEQHDGEHRADDADGGVLTVEVRGCALLDGLRDLAHAVVSVGLGENPFYGDEAIAQRQDRRGQGKQDCRVHNKNIPSIKCTCRTRFL